MPAAMASSSAAKNDTPGKGPSARRPSPSASFKNPQKTQSNKGSSSAPPTPEYTPTLPSYSGRTCALDHPNWSQRCSWQM